MADDQSCPRCDYDLTGAPGPACPECGIPFTAMPALNKRHWSTDIVYAVLVYTSVILALFWWGVLIFERTRIGTYPSERPFFAAATLFLSAGFATECVLFLRHWRDRLTAALCVLAFWILWTLFLIFGPYVEGFVALTMIFTYTLPVALIIGIGCWLITNRRKRTIRLWLPACISLACISVCLVLLHIVEPLFF